MPRKTRRHLSKGSQPRTHVIHGAYIPTRGCGFSIRNFRRCWSATISSIFPVNANKVRPWRSDLTEPSIAGIKQICWTDNTMRSVYVIQNLGTPTTRVTAPSRWGTVNVEMKTKTVFGCACSETKTFTLSFKICKELWCGPAATWEFLTRAKCLTGPSCTLQ